MNSSTKSNWILVGFCVFIVFIFVVFPIYMLRDGSSDYDDKLDIQKQVAVFSQCKPQMRYDFRAYHWYDRKIIYSHYEYNLTDSAFQAAVEYQKWVHTQLVKEY